MSQMAGDPSTPSSRRSLLKKGLVAGGIAWTAPVVTTLSQPVAAAVGSTTGSYTYCFDDGTSEGWTFDNASENGLWNVANDRSVSGSFSLHYGTGSGGNFNTGGVNSGTATSPIFTVPATGPADLVFDIWRGVEVFATGNWDEFSVSIVPGGTTLYSVARDGGTGGAFENVVLDLTPFAGTAVQIVFTFDTGDANFNNFEGIYVDNIVVPGATPPGGGGGGGTSLSARSAGSRSLVGPTWRPDRPEPTPQEQRRRDRAMRRESFAAGVAEGEELRSGIKQASE